MTMTEQEVISLSNEVAELYGVDAYDDYPSFNDDFDVEFFKFWLHDDWQRLMPLAIENGIDISYYKFCLYTHLPDCSFSQMVEYADHPTKERAVAVAILKALKAKKEK